MSLFSREFECPSCGAALQQNNAASKAISCGYCGQTSHIAMDKLEAAGQQHLLIDYGSALSYGSANRLREQAFTILGKVRLEYEDGFWDEWYIEREDGSNGWIQEDDGSFVLFEQVGKVPQSFNLNDITVGGSYTFSDEIQNMFVSSKGQATIKGGSGELPFKIIPGERADFIDGIMNGQPTSIELYDKEYLAFVGTPFDIEELELTNFFQN